MENQPHVPEVIPTFTATLIIRRFDPEVDDEPRWQDFDVELRGTDRVLDALESQRPLFTPERGQGYHAVTFGMYARELFERIAGETPGVFLARELFGPLDADVSLGTPAAFDARIATRWAQAAAALGFAAQGLSRSAALLAAILYHALHTVPVTLLGLFDAERLMVAFVSRLSAYAKAARAGFLVVPEYFGGM